MTYNAPIDDMITSLVATGINALEGMPAFEMYDSELLKPVLEEAGKFISEVIGPLNQSGHMTGSKLVENEIVTPAGFREAYTQFREAGWIGLQFPEKWGGQGMPRSLAMVVSEMIQSANMSFGLCPMLSCGAIEALLEHGSPELQDLYLPKLVSGEWTGTMNLTEPQAGSDVGALKTKAVNNGDGSYAISGQKIYITWGEHDMTENIVHLVLARLPDAPEGSRGISLFLVPKFHVDEHGQIGDRNGVQCIGIEQKLGIHASPTCVMEFDGATGWMIGEENRGLACMFTMMNAARLQVGIQGVGVAEAAFQAALEYSIDRKQGKSHLWKDDGAAPIIYHGDVQRNLMLMASKTAAARAICYACAVSGDRSIGEESPDEREKYKLLEEVLTPIAKAWSTDIGVEAASTGVQVHGGMGFMSETIAAQLYLDSRIAPIYEGTNGIQAADLVGRKLALGNGAGVEALLKEVQETVDLASGAADPEMKNLAIRLDEGLNALRDLTIWMSALLKDNRNKAVCLATPYLDVFGDVLGGHYLIRQLVAGTDQTIPTERGKTITQFYCNSILPLAEGKSKAIKVEYDALEKAPASVFGL